MERAVDEDFCWAGANAAALAMREARMAVFMAAMVVMVVSNESNKRL